MGLTTMLGLGRKQNTKTNTNTKLAIAEKYRSSTWFIVSAVLLANFTDLFIYSVIVPVAPFALPLRAGIAEEDTQYWVSITLAVFNIFSITTSLPSGWISDKLGVRRPMFVIGAIIQFAGLALLTIGNSITLWIISRALQGIACAIVLTTTLPLLLTVAPKEQSGRYFGLFSLSASLALVSGPLVGGVVYERCGYYAVFAICIALNSLDVIMRALIIEKKRKPEPLTPAKLEEADITTEKHTKSSVDKPERKTTISILELSTPHDTDTDSTTTNPPKSTSPIISLISSPRMLAALYGALLYTSIQTAMDATLPLFVNSTFAWNSLGAGLVFIPLLLSDLAGPIFGFLSDKFGAKRCCVFGFIFGTAPLVCLRFVEKDSIQHKVLLCGLLAMVGLGMAAVLPAVMAEIGAVIDAKGLVGENGSEDVGAVSRAYGLFNIAYSGGCLIGPLWGGLVRESAGWGTMSWSLAIFWVSGIIPALLWLD